MGMSFSRTVMGSSLFSYPLVPLSECTKTYATRSPTPGAAPRIVVKIMVPWSRSLSLLASSTCACLALYPFGAPGLSDLLSVRLPMPFVMISSDMSILPKNRSDIISLQ